MKCKSDTQKILAVRDYHKGKKVVDICKEYNCAKSTFYTWVRPYTEKKNSLHFCKRNSFWPLQIFLISTNHNKPHLSFLEV